MTSADDIKKKIEQLNYRSTDVMRSRILSEASKAMEQTINASADKPGVWRMIMNSKSFKYTAAIIVFITVIVSIQIFSIDSTTQVFAKAIQRVKEARTLSCIERFGTKKVIEQKRIFKAPDLMRHTILAGVDDNFLGEATIINYSLRKQLIVNPNNKTAELIDMSSEYVVNDNTGEVELSQLDTSLRDRLLSLSANAVEDLGKEMLNGNSVRKLQSKDDRKITTVWVEPKSNLPVQIELQYSNRIVKYSEIKIDEVIDDDQFSFAAPSGYEFKKHISNWPDEKRKVSARVMFLLVKCWEYASNNNYQYPETLADLKSTGLSEEALQNILSGDSLIEYAKPDLKADTSAEIAIYEAFDQWPADGIVVGYADGHAELVATEQAFNDIVSKKSNEGN